MKWWALLSVIGLIPCSALSLLLSSAIHFQLNGDAGLSGVTLSGMIHSVSTDKRHFALFACVLFLLLLLIVLLIFTNRHGGYESDLRTITPKIKTPVSAGQSQHGSAKWLEKSLFSKAFTMAVIDFEHPVIKELIEHGTDPVKKGKATQPGKPVVKKTKKKKPKLRPTAGQISIVSGGWSGDWLKE